MSFDNCTNAFLELVRAGLWEKEALLSQYSNIDFGDLLRIAEEQSVVGLVAAGLDHVADSKVPQEILLQFVGEALQIEQQNREMNLFIEKLIQNLRYADIYTLLVKGQGIAQCYERPLWRASGDVDLFLSEDNYKKTKSYLTPLASHVDNERPENKHLAMSIDSWEVELHGSLRCGLWSSLDCVLDNVQKEVFCGGAVKSWMNNSTQVFILRADEDVVYVFSHILNHLFWGGVGLRQVCDWCRLLWTYKDSLNYRLLESRIRKMGVMTEWKAFAALAVNCLGMPRDAMPFYSQEKKWANKSGKILSYILETGNFGHNRDITYQSKYPAFTRKFLTFMRQAADSFFLMNIFPLDSMKSLYSFWKNGIKAAVKRK